MTSANRIINQLGLHGSSQGDAELVQQLQLYKTPAIIRDTKQVFFYVQCFANTTQISPYRLFTNKSNVYAAAGGTPPNDIIQPLDVPSYYCPIGTKRKFKIWEQVNSLIDIRVPKDKYYLDISMVEAQVEASPESWTKQRNFAKVPPSPPQPGVDFELQRTFDVEYEFDGAVPANGSKQYIDKTYFKEATKKSVPQPLFVRIPQLSNGEPYNWSVVNNGAFNEDKSHSVVVRHGDIDYQELELEFGHLTYQGTDTDYEQFGKNDVSNAPGGDPEWNLSLVGPNVKNQINNYQRYTYLDYNWEWPNAETQQTDVNVNNKYVAPASRNDWVFNNGSDITGDPGTNDVLLASDPLKFNQQVANLTFRFMVKVVHLW